MKVESTTLPTMNLNNELIAYHEIDQAFLHFRLSSISGYQVLRQFSTMNALLTRICGRISKASLSRILIEYTIGLIYLKIGSADSWQSI
jgi:hypothetical protein